MSWDKLIDWNENENNPELAAAVQTTRDGFLVSIRYVKEGWVEDIVGDKRAAVATGRTVDAAFARAMRIAEEELFIEEEPEPPRRMRRRR
jgi:hypothetical protein